MQDKVSLAIFALVIALVMGALTLVGYGMHIFTTAQFLVGFATALAIGGACVSVIFPSGD